MLITPEGGRVNKFWLLFSNEEVWPKLFKGRNYFIWRKTEYSASFNILCEYAQYFTVYNVVIGVIEAL